MTRCRHLEAIKDELREAGATAIRHERRGGTMWVSWTLKGQSQRMAIGATTRDPVGAAKHNHRRLHRLYPEVRPS